MVRSPVRLATVLEQASSALYTPAGLCIILFILITSKSANGVTLQWW